MLNRCVFRYSSCFVLEFQEVLKDKWKVEGKKEGGQAGRQAGWEGRGRLEGHGGRTEVFA